MWRIRLFEEEADRQTNLGNVVGTLHMYCGEEAVAVGVCSQLRPDDYVLGTHRSHGHCLAKGANINEMMAELFGKATGTCGGKGGSMHVADFSLNMLGANGIDGAGIQRLAILDKTNVAAVTVDAMTSCIGNARSTWDDGIISHINKQATQRGVRVGMTTVDFADLLS